MNSTFSQQVQSAFNITEQEWNALPLVCRLERIADHLGDLLEIHEHRLGTTDGPGTAFRAEFSRLSNAVPRQRIVRTPDFEKRCVVRDMEVDLDNHGLRLGLHQAG